MAYWKACGRLFVSADWTFFASCHRWRTMSRYIRNNYRRVTNRHTNRHITTALKGWVTLNANFRQKRHRPQSIHGPLDRGMMYQQRCLWNFSHKETLQQTSFDWISILLAKQENCVLCLLLGILLVTHTAHIWLVGKRVVNFPLVLAEHFSLALIVEALWADMVVFERGGSLWAQISGEWGVAHQLLLVPEN